MDYLNSEEYKKRERHINFAYELGVKNQDSRIVDMVYSGDLPEWIIDNDLYYTAFEAGKQGEDIPRFVSGWRYGDIPKGGKSYDYRNQRNESGTSMMEIYDNGKKQKTQDLVAARLLKEQGRPVRKIMGWLNTIRRGADNEPLLLNPLYHPDTTKEMEDEKLKEENKKKERVDFVKKSMKKAKSIL